MRELTKEQLEAVNEAWMNCEDSDELNDFLKEKGLIKQEFEVEKWYKQIDGDSVWFATKIVNPEWGCFMYGYGFHNNDLKWSNNKCSNVTANQYRLATDKEVQDALIKEAKKRGFKEGVYVNSFASEGCYAHNNEIIDHYDSTSIFFDAKENSFSMGNKCLMIDGLWAEIVKEDNADKAKEL